MGYQLISLDLDGTLLTDEKEITPETVDLLERLREEGKYIVISTGRAMLSVRSLLKDSGFATHVITDNGGTVHELATNETLYTRTIARSFLGTMKDVMRTYGVHCDATTMQHVYVEFLTEEMMRLYGQYLLQPVAIGDLREAPEDPIKFTVSGKPDVIDQVEPELVTKYGDELHIVRSGECFIDIMKAGTTKGTALQALVKHLNLAAEDVLAIGNYYNDLEMLQYAGLGIAMDNSPDDLKAVADEVTLSNNEDGVRVALEKRVLRHGLAR